MNTTTQTSRCDARGLSSQFCPATGALMPNRVRSFDRFHISYNARSIDYGCPTTALVLMGRVFFVLNGDHVADMADAAGRDGVQGCVNLFIERIQDANALSEHAMAVGLTADPFDLRQTTLDLIGQGCVDRIIAALSRQRA